MKISSTVMAEAMKTNDIQMEIHERVPYFKIKDFTSRQALCDGDIKDSFYTTLINEQLYVKLGSEHRNSDGTFSGQEPTYSGDMALEIQKLWVDELGVENLVSPSDFELLQTSADNDII